MQTQEEVRIGVYTCLCGGNIGDVVNCEAVAKAVSRLPNVVVSRTDLSMCSDAGQTQLEEDIKERGVNRVVIGACAPSLHEKTFRGAVARAGLNPYFYHHVGLREQASWVHHDDPEGATAKAIRLMAAGIAKARLLEPLQPIQLKAEQHALVIGSGVAGLRAAWDIARRGIRVTLVEKSATLGGRVTQLGSLFPTGEAASELLKRLIKEVTAHPKISIYTQAELVGIKGYVGDFQATVRRENTPELLGVNVGAVVVATGFKPYEPFHGEYGYHEFPQVITLPDFIRLLRLLDEGEALHWHGRSVQNIAFIHCVGSRQIDGINQPQPDGQVNNYCSRVCCTATLHTANEVHERFPNVNIFDFYEDIRTYGRGHEAYYNLASQNMVRFLRFHDDEMPEVVAAAPEDEHPLLIKVKDYLTWGEEMEVPVDLVVLAVGMMPEPVPDIIKLLKIAPGTDRFLLEVHPKLRPVETAVPGVVLAGTAQGPMNIQESCAAASAAAAKVAVLLAQGQVELEPFVARVNPERCDGSGACVAVCCYEDAITLQTVGENGRTAQKAVVTPANCAGCGICVSACPNQAIDLQGWTLPQYEAMIDALVTPVPAEMEFAS
ncbi:MAG: disulfide reductase [Anaerolineaceae bacterium]|nr:disulfide reductase [Anaerolineaceae bacterium]